MRVAECVEIGPMDGLAIVEHPDPVAGPGMVVVRVEAAGVNYVDALFVQGRYQIKPPVPFVPGSEIAGAIIAVGDGVDGTLVGRRVVSMCGLGGFAEQAVIPAVAAVPIPDALDAPRAAVFIQSFCTARFALDQRASLEAGERVLVLGAGGGVGQATVAVARAAGAHVAAVASTPAKRAAALAAGAAVAFDAAGRRSDAAGEIDDSAADQGDTSNDATALVHAVRDWSDGGVDIALDPVGGPLSIAALRALGLFGRLLVIGFPAGIAELPANQILLRNRAVLGVDWGAWSMKDPAGQRALLDDLLDDVAAGRLEPPAPETRPLEAVVGALEDLTERRVTGKLVLVP
ncbi:MAG TPA: zinc-binding dehydrogenase [Acidimicrobiales bacterium]|nr:zinc-binding dehydrogenase [Acidimicrobiales bacterium]